MDECPVSPQRPSSQSMADDGGRSRWSAEIEWTSEPGDLPRKVTEGALHSLVGGNYLVVQLVSRCESADARMGTAVSHRFIMADHSQFSFLGPLPSLYELLTPGLSDDDQ